MAKDCKGFGDSTLAVLGFACLAVFGVESRWWEAELEEQKMSTKPNNPKLQNTFRHKTKRAVRIPASNPRAIRGATVGPK